MNKKNIVIVGANFAGLGAAGQFPMKKRGDLRDIKVTVIDQCTEFEWTPNIHEILSGIKSKQNVYLSRLDILRRLGHEFLQDQVINIDVETQQIELEHHGFKNYDACLIACGHTENHHGIEGVAEHTVAFRTAGEAQQIKSRLDDFRKSKCAARVVIVGGGYSGIEALGELLRKYRNDQNITFCVVEPSGRLLNGLPEVIADDVMSLAESHRVEFITNKHITHIARDALEFSDGSSISADLIVWTAGTKLPDWLDKFMLGTSRPAGILVNQYLQTRSHPSVFVAGDAAKPLPSLKKQAHHALDMGALAARNIGSWLENNPMAKYHALEKPVVLSFGDLNSYLVQGETVLASPALAATKEIVFQFYMAKLSTLLPVNELSMGVATRLFGSVQNLLLPGMSSLKLLTLLKSSRVLQSGGIKDIEDMARAMMALPESNRN